MQRAVEEHWLDLEAPLLDRLAGARSLEWPSPVAHDEYAEYRDTAFLGRVGLSHLAGELSVFWPRRGPQWDGLAVSDAGHVLLIEAKAHIGEFCAPPSKASEVSMVQIRVDLDATARELNVRDEFRPAWGQYFYQYTNRLAHLLWLRNRRVDAKLVLIGFIGDIDMPGNTTIDAWEAAYRLSKHVLGLYERHPMAKHVFHVHPDVRLHL